MPRRPRFGLVPFLSAGVCLANLAWSGEPAPAVGATASTPQATEPHFAVGEYRVLGNSALKPIDIERVLYPLLGTGKTLSDVQVARAALEKLYRDRGFGTVYVDIPPQTVNEGIVRLRVTEGRVGRSEISGARYFSEGDILKQLPAATPGTVLKIPELQQQLAAVNRETPDRSVVPVLKAGAAPGTVDVALQARDNLPLHGSLELNNQQTVDTRPLRAVVGLSYDELFGRLDTLSLQYQMTPQQLGQVRVFAANYALEPWSSGLQGSLLYINSNTNVATVGTLGVLGKGDIAGARLTYPVVTAEQSSQSLTAGVDYKQFRNTVNLNGTTGLNTPINYVNLSLAYAGSWRTAGTTTTLSLSADAGPRGIANNPLAFENDRYQARANYFYLRGDLATVIKLPADFSLRLRTAGQATMEPLISNENYSIAGADGVRSYLESEELGDSAVKGTVQLQSPTLRGLDRPLADGYVFFDAGRTEIIDPLAGQRGHTTLRSWGGGLDLLPGQKLTGTLTWAKALATGSSTQAGDSRLLFLMRGAF